MTFAEPDLQKLDLLWPLGKLLTVFDDQVIFVAGAYKGYYCRYLSRRFPTAKIYGFEPQRHLIKEFDYKSYPNVELFPFGIGVSALTVDQMGDSNTDGCSLLKTSNELTMGLFVASAAIREWLGIVNKVSLAVLNMEGCEYPLLNDWLNTGEINKYTSLAVQFHPELVSMPVDVLKKLMDHYGEPIYFDHPTWSYWRKS